MEIIKKAKERQDAERRKLANAVDEIIENVRKNGDSALREYNR